MDGESPKPTGAPVLVGYLPPYQYGTAAGIDRAVVETPAVLTRRRLTAEEREAQGIDFPWATTERDPLDRPAVVIREDIDSRDALWRQLGL